MKFEYYLEQENQILNKLKKREKGKRRRGKKNKLKNIYEYQQWKREQNEKAIKHNQDIDKLEKEKLKEQWKRDELKEKKVL